MMEDLDHLLSTDDPPAKKPPAVPAPAGNYEDKLVAWANDKVKQGADPDAVSAKLNEHIHAYRSSLANKPDELGPETTGERVMGQLSSAYQGMTLGAGNKITAGVRTVLPEALGGTKGFDFPQALKEQTGVLQDYEQRHPVESFATNIGGSVLPMIATGGMSAGAEGGGMLARIGQMLKGGAKYGATSGALSANSPEDIIPGAVRGAAIGAVAAPAVGIPLGAASRGLANVARRLAPNVVTEAAANAVGASPVSPAGKAQAAIAGALTKGGVDPAEAAGRVAQTDAPTTAMELGSRGVSRIARQARNVPQSSAQQDIDSFLSDRAAGSGKRVEGSLAEHTGYTPTDVEKPIEDIIAQRAKDAAPAYQKAYDYGEIKDPKTIAMIAEIRQNPTFEKAWQRGQSIGDLEGGSAPVEAPKGIDPNVWDTLTPGQQARALSITTGTAGTAPQGPTVKQVDLWKRGLDAQIETGARSENGLSRTEARLYRGKLKDILAQVDAEVPDYQAARAQFRGHSELADAAEMGAQHFKPSTNMGAVTRQLTDMSPAEQDMYRRNALNAVVEKVRTVAANPDLPEAAKGTDIVKRIMGTEDAGGRLKMLFADDQSYQKFLGAMEQEALYPKTRQAVTGGSNTAAQLAEQAVSPGAWRDAALAVGTHGIYPKARLAQRGLQALFSKGMDVPTADEIGKQVTATGPGLATLLQRIKEYDLPRAANRQATNLRAGNLVAAQAGQAGNP